MSNFLSTQPSFKDVSKVLLESGFLNLRDYVYLQSAQKKPKDWLEFAQYFQPGVQYQLARLHMWRASLNSARFSEQEYLWHRKHGQHLNCNNTNNSNSNPSSTCIDRHDEDNSSEEAALLREMGVSVTVLRKYRAALIGVDAETVTRFSAGVEGEVMRDVLRTFQTIAFFQDAGAGRLMLLRILLAISRAADTSLGYCQGMNFVVGTMLQCALLTDPERRTSTYSNNNSNNNSNTDNNSHDYHNNGSNSDSHKSDNKSLHSNIIKNNNTNSSTNYSTNTAGSDNYSDDNQHHNHQTHPIQIENDHNTSTTTTTTTTTNTYGDHATTSILSNPLKSEIVEAIIFDLMLSLIDKHGKLGFLGLWAEKIPKLKLRVYQLDRLLRWFCPRLHAHFSIIELSPEVLTAQWFLTLFCYSLGVWDTMKVWDYVFLGGWEGLFRVAVSLLASIEEELLLIQDMEGVSLLMKHWRNHPKGLLGDRLSVTQVFQRAQRLTITEEVLLKLQEAFAQEVLVLGRLRYLELRRLYKKKILAQKLSGASGASTPTKSNNNNSNINSNTNNGDKEDESKYLDSDNDDNDDNTTNSNTDGNDNSDKKSIHEHEKPVFWLQKYAYKLTLPTLKDLRHQQLAIQRLDAQIDADKNLLTQKILGACEQQQVISDQRVSVTEAVCQLRNMRDRLIRRLSKWQSRAHRISHEAEKAAFAIRQVQLLDEELKRSQLTGKLPMSLLTGTHQNHNGNSINNNNYTSHNSGSSGGGSSFSRFRVGSLMERVKQRLRPSGTTTAANANVSTNNTSTNNTISHNTSGSKNMEVVGEAVIINTIINTNTNIDTRKSDSSSASTYSTNDNDSVDNSNSDKNHSSANTSGTNAHNTSSVLRLRDQLHPTTHNQNNNHHSVDNSKKHTHNSTIESTHNSTNSHYIHDRRTRHPRLRALLHPHHNNNDNNSDSHSDSVSMTGSVSEALSGLQSLVTNLQDLLSPSMSHNHVHNSDFNRSKDTNSSNNNVQNNTNNIHGNSSSLASLLTYYPAALLMTALPTDDSTVSETSPTVPNSFKNSAMHSGNSTNANSTNPDNHSSNSSTLVGGLVSIRHLAAEDWQLLGDLDRDSCSTATTTTTYSENSGSTKTNNNPCDSNTGDFNTNANYGDDKNKNNINSDHNTNTNNDDDSNNNHDDNNNALLLSSNEEPVEQMRRLERESRQAQRAIILLNRVLGEVEKLYQTSVSELQHVQLREEEVTLFKTRLCDQLHLLVEDSNRGRSQKLLYVADNFLL